MVTQTCYKIIAVRESSDKADERESTNLEGNGKIVGRMGIIGNDSPCMKTKSIVGG